MKRFTSAVLVALTAALLATANVSHAQNGTWNVDADGAWTLDTNWLSDIIADGSGNTASFTSELTDNRTVTLGTDRTIGNITFTDGTTSSHDLTISGADILTLAGTTPTVNVTQADRTLSIGSAVAGTAGLTKSGAGTLTLSTANTYTGGTAITAGTLRLSGTGTLGATGASVAVSSGALLDLNGTNQSVAFTGTGNGTVANNSGSGTSILTLSANPAAANSIVIADNTNASSGTVAVVIAAITSNMSISNTYSGGTTVNGAVRLNLAGEPTRAGTGTINLTTAGVDGTGSGLLYNAGTSVANDITGAGYIRNNTNGGGTITLTGNLNTSAIFNNRATNQVWDFAGNGTTSTVSGVIGASALGSENSAAGRIIKSGTGTLTLSGNSIYTGTTTIAGGTLRLGATGGATNTPLGTAANGTLVSGTGTLDLAGFTLGTAEALSLAGTGTSSSGALANTGGAATYSGLVTLTGAASIVSGGNLILSNTGTITGAGHGLTLGGTATGSSVGSIIGTTTGTLIKEGSGTWTLTRANTYTGATTVNEGTLLVDGSLAAGSAVSVGANGAIGGTGTINGTINFDALSLLHIVDLMGPLTTVGTVTFGSGFGIANLTGIDWDTVALDTPFTLLDTTQTFSSSNIANFGLANAVPVGTGRSAYFESGSLQLIVVPEPSTFALAAIGIAGIAYVAHRRRQS